MHTEGFERGENRRGKIGKIQAVLPFRRRKEGIVDVAEVVIDRAAARDPTGNVNTVSLNIVHRQLGVGILIFSNHDGRLVLPKQKYVVVAMQKQIFLDRQIAVRIGRFLN